MDTIVAAFMKAHPVGSCIIVFDGDNYLGPNNGSFCPFTELINRLIAAGHYVHAFKNQIRVLLINGPQTQVSRVIYPVYLTLMTPLYP